MLPLSSGIRTATAADGRVSETEGTLKKDGQSMAKAHFVVDTTGGGVDVKTTGSFFFELSSYTEDGTKKISVVLNADGKAVRREYSIEKGKLVAEEIIDLLRLHKEAE